MSEKYPRIRVPKIALLATLALVGCTPTEHNTPPPAANATVAVPGSAAPSKLPELQLPLANAASNRGRLISCFAGGIALPPHVPLKDSRRIDDAETKTAVNMPADLQARVHTADVKLQTREARELYVTSGTTILSGPNGAWVGGPAHATFGTRNPADITIIDTNGKSHKPDAGCYVYNVNGAAVPLDASATKPNDSGTVNDDLLWLHVTDPMPGALPLADASPTYGESLYFGGYPLRNGQQGTEVYGKACLQVFSRDGTFSASCASLDAPEEGQSGIAMVTAAGSVVGFLGGYQRLTPEVWANNGHVYGDASYFEVDYTDQSLAAGALQAAQDQYAR